MTTTPRKSNRDSIYEQARLLGQSANVLELFVAGRYDNTEALRTAYAAKARSIDIIRRLRIEKRKLAAAKAASA